MKVSFKKLAQMYTAILKTSDASEKEVQIMADIGLDYDLRLNTFSTLSGVESHRDDLKNSVGIKHEIVVNKPAMKLINAHGKSALLVGAEMVYLVCDMAKTQGIAIVGIYNSTYHEGMGWYARKIAEQNLVGIVAANGGPSCVTPFGGGEPIMGTNPLAYGIPTNDIPIVFDAATGKYPYGSIRLAKGRGQKLPEASYINKNGTFTTDPHEAIGIIPFGEHKGYAVNLLLEVLTGIMVRAKSGLKVKDEKDLGSFFIAIDPNLFSPIADFKKEVTQLVTDIQKSRPLPDFDAVRIPGYQGEHLKRKILKVDEIQIEDKVWKEFEKVYKKVVTDEK